jgi:hypothetical protein
MLIRKLAIAISFCILVFDAYALPSNCYIFSVGEPVLRGDTIYYPVRRVCYNSNGEKYRVQESEYTVDEINAESYEPAPMPAVPEP